MSERHHAGAFSDTAMKSSVGTLRFVAPRFVAVGLFYLVCVLGNTLAAQPGVGDTAKANHVEIAQRLVRAAFPELNAYPYQVLVTITAELKNDWNVFGLIGVHVTTGAHNHPEQDARTDPEAILGGIVDVHPKGRYLHRVHFSGTLVHGREMTDVAESIERDRNWTDETLLEALTALSARYPPNRQREFEAQLRLDRFESALGRLGKPAVEFVWRFRLAGSDWTFLPPRWQVSVEALSGDQPVCYDMFFEPISGHLVSIEGRYCDAP